MFGSHCSVILRDLEREREREYQTEGLEMKNAVSKKIGCRPWYSIVVSVSIVHWCMFYFDFEQYLGNI